MLSLLSRGDFQEKMANVVKNFLTLILNDLGLKLLTLNQVFEEVNA